MKKEVTIFIVIAVFPTVLFAQIELDFKFFDSCQDSVVLLDYELHGEDTIFLSTKNIATVKSKGYYTLSVAVQRSELTCYKNYQIIIDENYRSDTLYFNKISLCNSGALHAEENYYYYCKEKCKGIEIEKDNSGIVRTRGDFVNGWPEGKLRFYDNQGFLMETEIHRNGKLIKIK